MIRRLVSAALWGGVAALVVPFAMRVFGHRTAEEQASFLLILVVILAAQRGWDRAGTAKRRED